MNATKYRVIDARNYPNKYAEHKDSIDRAPFEVQSAQPGRKFTTIPGAHYRTRLEAHYCALRHGKGWELRTAGVADWILRDPTTNRTIAAIYRESIDPRRYFFNRTMPAPAPLTGYAESLERAAALAGDYDTDPAPVLTDKEHAQ